MPGKSLIERIRFERPVSASDGQGGRKDGWETAITCRAQYTRLRGSEKVLADRLEGIQATVIRVRSAAQTRAVTTDWRIVDDRTGETFNIRSSIETDDRIYIDFAAESGVAT